MTFADAIRKGLAVHAKISSARAAIDSVLERASQEVGDFMRTKIRFSVTDDGSLVVTRAGDAMRVVIGSLKLSGCGWPVEIRGGSLVCRPGEATFADDLADVISQPSVAEAIYRLGVGSERGHVGLRRTAG